MALYTETEIEMAKGLIASDKVVIFSNPSCPYCKIAKECFERLNVKFTAVELDKPPFPYIFPLIFNMTGDKTLPRVFMDGKFLGGGLDVKSLYDSGKLATMIGNERTV